MHTNNTDSPNHSEFIFSDGMVLRELIEYKEIKLTDLYSILGPESLIQEILMDKRKLKEKQKSLLAEYFGTNRDIFSGQDEGTNNIYNTNEENNFRANEGEALPQINYEDQKEIPNDDQTNDFDDHHDLNSMWE